MKPGRYDGPNRTLQRDLLLPCGFLPAGEESSIEASSVSRPGTWQQRKMPLDSEDSVEEDPPPEPTTVSLDPCPVKFTLEKVHRKAPSLSVANDCFLPPTLPASEPTAIVDVEREREHFPEEVLSVEAAEQNLPEHLLVSEAEKEQSDELPMERNPPDYSPHPVSPEFTEVPLNEDAEESVDPEALASDVSEPPHFDVSPDLIDSEPVVRRFVRPRVPPKRLQYSSLGNPLISVV